MSLDILLVLFCWFFSWFRLLPTVTACNFCWRETCAEVLKGICECPCKTLQWCFLSAPLENRIRGKICIYLVIFSTVVLTPAETFRIAL